MQGPGDGGWTPDTLSDASTAPELCDVTTAFHTLSKDLGKVPGSIITFRYSTLRLSLRERRDFSEREKQEELYSDSFFVGPTYF